MQSAHRLAEEEQDPWDSAKAVIECLNASRVLMSVLMSEACGDAAAQSSIIPAAPQPRSAPAVQVACDGMGTKANGASCCNAFEVAGACKRL